MDGGWNDHLSFWLHERRQVETLQLLARGDLFLGFACLAERLVRNSRITNNKITQNDCEMNEQRKLINWIKFSLWRTNQDDDDADHRWVSGTAL